MCRWIPRAPGRGAMWFALAVLAPAVMPAAAWAGAVPPIDRPAAVWADPGQPAAATDPAHGISQVPAWLWLDADDARRETGDADTGDSARVTFDVSPSAAQAEAPVVVPLPPALGTGLVGLAAMAILRVGRRVYRRS